MSVQAPADLREQVHEAARRARIAARTLATLTTETKNRALHTAADAVLAAVHQVLAANAEDVAAARAAGTAEAMIDRLALNPQRLDGIAAGLRQVAGLPDPVGEVLRGSTLPNGLQIRQQRVPLGVVGMVYEGRPNVTVDAFGLTLKSGNAALLRGSSSAARSNQALVTALRSALVGEGLPEDAVQLLPSEDRASVTHLIQARGLVDVVIPRGGAGLIDAVVRDATVPTIETGVGNCHVFVHEAADLDVAERILLNSKTRRPSVCNTAETVLVDAAIAETAVPKLLQALQMHDVVVHGDLPGLVPATEDDWSKEYLTLDVALKVVKDLDAAVEHIDQVGRAVVRRVVVVRAVARRLVGRQHREAQAARRRRPTQPMAPRPAPSSAQVWGSGTGVVRTAMKVPQRDPPVPPG